MTIRVNGANDGLTAVNDSYTVNEDVLLNATSVLTNDIDVDGDDLDVVRVGGSTIADGGVGDLDGVVGSITFNTTAGGTAVINLENGTFSYNQNGLFTAWTPARPGRTASSTLPTTEPRIQTSRPSTSPSMASTKARL